MSVLLISLLLAIIGGIIFSIIGLISGTDETATLVPFTLIVVLLGTPPEAVFAFFMSAILAKHLTHAIPTALMGVPGDTMAVPLLDHAAALRRIGVPHVALRKMVSGGVLAAFIALPVSLAFAQLLAGFSDLFKESAGVIFTVAAVIIAYFSKGRYVSIVLILPLAMLMQSLNLMAFDNLGKNLSISFFLGIAIGPMFADMMFALSSSARQSLLRDRPKEYHLAPEVRSWSGYFPNPFRVLTKRQTAYTSGAAFLSSLTFAFSPVGMTSLFGETTAARTRGLYKKSTTSLSVMNGVTESTYIAETVIPLVAFGIPLSPVALGPAAALFNAPPVFTSDPVHNLHSLLSVWDFLIYGLLGMIVAFLIAYPFTMNYARKATVWVMKNISHEAIIGMFMGLVAVLAFYEGELVGILVTFAVATVGGLLNRILGMGSGVQFMVFYGSSWMLAQIVG